MPTRTHIPLRRRDVAVLGHVTYATYHEYLAEGRAAMFKSAPDLRFAVARVEMDFRAEVTLDHAYVDVVMRTESIGTSSFTIAHEIVLPDGAIAARGCTVLVAWDPIRRCSHELTSEQRAFLQAQA